MVIRYWRWGNMKKKCTVCGMVFEEEYEGEGCPRCGYEGWFEKEDKED
jgi:predicted  nucleic acid-binding Zn-ribbon protein